MKEIIIENSSIPKALSVFIDIWAITLYPFIICRGKLDEITKNHERIHLAQQRELWLFGFYFLYVSYWIIAKVRGLNNRQAYLSIPFEREAYENQLEQHYLQQRKNHAWRAYKKNS